MSLASTLLRVVLMLSLLLNGLNAAMASGHEEMGRMAHAAAAAVDGGTPDCHHHAGMQADPAPQAKAPPHDAHFQIKDCVRSCAQHPLLVVLHPDIAQVQAAAADGNAEAQEQLDIIASFPRPE